MKTTSPTMKTGFCSAVLLAFLLVPVDAVAQESYAVYALPTLGGPSNSAYGLNDLGQVVGSSSLNFEPGGDSHGYLWDAGTLTDLGILGGSNSVGFDVNNAAQVTGYAELVTGVQHAFLWQNGVMTDLMAAYPSTFGSGWGINEFGQVTGHYGAAAFFWENGVLTDLGSLCGSPVRAYGINNAGQVVGHSSLCAIFWQDDGDPQTNDMRRLGTLPGGLSRTRARGINDVGQVVGEANYGSPDLEDYHAVLWENLSWDAAGNYTGDITDLGQLPGGQRSFAYAVNNAGQVVGYASSAGIGSSHAFIWDRLNGLRDLNDLIPPGSGWTLRFAMDINQVGQIVGSGYFNGQTRGFLLTPFPAGACCLGGGICFVTSPARCAAAAGSYQGDGTTCTPNPCPLSTGACCLADGTCSALPAALCDAAGGTYQGDGTTCTPNPCTGATGACCFPDGSCIQVSELACAVAGGNHGGIGSTCVPNPCEQPQAACCFADGSCSDMIETDCTAAGGVYRGYGTLCGQPAVCQNLCMLPGDTNGDGFVRGDDIAGYVRIKLGSPGPGDQVACADYGTGTLDGDTALFIADLLNP